MVLTLQFSAALELTNDGGRKGCTGSSLRSSSGQNLGGQSSEGNIGQMQWRVLVPHSPGLCTLLMCNF